MVIEGDGRRLALECDGDRYHPVEKLAEDVERQAILERLGWQFVRIRGSAFYRNPDRAMEAVFSRLTELGIPPVGTDIEAQSSDMTLIHELTALMSAGDETLAAADEDGDIDGERFENCGSDFDATLTKDNGAFASRSNGLKTSPASESPANGSRGQLEAILESFGAPHLSRT